MTRAAKTTLCYLLLSTVEVMKGTSQKRRSPSRLYTKWNQHKSSWKNSRVHVPIQPSSSFDSMLSTAGSPGAFCWSFSSLHLPVETSDLICASLITDAKDRLDGCSNVPLIRRGMRQKRTPQVFLRDLSMLEGLVDDVDGIKEPWFKLLKWKQVGQPPRYLHPLAATRLYARHACLPSSRSKTWAVWRAQKTAFHLFTTDSFFEVTDQ